MRFSMLAGALAAALMVSACNTPIIDHAPPPGSTPVPSGTTAISAAAQRALYAAEAAYNVPASIYVALDTRGALPADIKAKAKPALVAAYQALQAARSAAAAGDSLGVLAATADITKQAGVAQAILPPAQ